MQGLVNLRTTDHIIFIFGYNVPLVKQFLKIGEKFVFRPRLPWKRRLSWILKGKFARKVINTSCSPNPMKFHRCIVVDKLQTQMKSFVHLFTK